MSSHASYGTTPNSHSHTQQASGQAKTMNDNASVASYSSTSSLLKSKFKSSTTGWTPSKVQEQAFKTQGRKEKLKMPIMPRTAGPNPFV